MRKLTLVILALLITASSAVFAQSERKGFFIGFAPQLTYAMSSIDKIGGGFNFQIGGGINENVILYGKSQNHSYDVAGSTAIFSDLTFNAKYILNDDMPFYANLGLGFAMDDNDNSGYTMEVASGYEWRTGEKFFMAPELFYNYRNISSSGLNTIGVSYTFGWYF